MPTRSLSPIVELDRSDVNAILARNHVGRLAFARGREIDVLPVHYAYSAGCVFGRTSPGGKLDRMNRAGTTVAFQVDEIDSLYRWRSVLAHGTFQVLSRLEEQEEWLRALGLLRRLAPDALREEDPAPHRTELFRVLVHRATGRALG